MLEVNSHSRFPLLSELVFRIMFNLRRCRGANFRFRLTTIHQPGDKKNNNCKAEGRPDDCTDNQLRIIVILGTGLTWKSKEMMKNKHVAHAVCGVEWWW